MNELVKLIVVLIMSVSIGVVALRFGTHGVKNQCHKAIDFILWYVLCVWLIIQEIKDDRPILQSVKGWLLITLGIVSLGFGLFKLIVFFK